jgi:hypothetical protein
MTRRVIAVTLLIGAGLVALSSPASAKTTNPCKVLKTSEIEAEFDATVSDPTKGLKTAANASCNWEVDATSSRPSGAMTTTVMFVGGKAAYDGLKDTPGYESVSELGKAFYDPSTGALNVLDGKNLVVVQGVFLTETLPIQKVDVKPELISLAKIAVKRT